MNNKIKKKRKKKTLHKNRAGGVAQGEGPEFKPQYSEEKKKRKENRWTSQDGDTSQTAD
jgi:hypothetical protein